MPKFCHFIANNRLDSTISSGSRQNVLGCYNLIFGLISIKFYMNTQGIIRFHLNLHLPDLDEILKS